MYTCPLVPARGRRGRPYRSLDQFHQAAQKASPISQETARPEAPTSKQTKATIEASYIPLASDRLSSLFWTRLPNAAVQNRAIFIRLIMRPTERNRRGIDFKIEDDRAKESGINRAGTTRSNQSVWQRPLSRVISCADIENAAARQSTATQFAGSRLMRLPPGVTKRSARATRDHVRA